MTIDKIYDKYKIPKILREHMYRVAVVSEIICDSMHGDICINKDLVIKTALLHDMGNIIKIYIVDSSFIANDEKEELEMDKKEFIEKYGDEEHTATDKILNEIGVSKDIIDLYNNLGSSKIPQTINSNDWNRKICSYSDFRVAPYGIVSVTERFDEIIKRYKGKSHILSDVLKTEQKKKEALILESQMQEKCSMDLSLINDDLIKNKVIELKNYKIN